MATNPKSLRHSFLRTLALKWIRIQHPRVYKGLRKKAEEKYPTKGEINDTK